ncbi:uncharacterized protein SPSK_03776 [Sporothrix schenckii 1099-18]|uniref:Uncharacterized protein n=1 Tax=Sporothrix schenckii 1099-18 TaxID=1397361 RepID=A0A0F2M1M4_SPOSC|nr:uncharacterized protein SPSK_03776 [Sporothrix schenckii 1099-18]KJR82670.1 hypothetical protein SPSK_03776 [Sporothrix schenckii 1099-18]
MTERCWMFGTRHVIDWCVGWGAVPTKEGVDKNQLAVVVVVVVVGSVDTGEVKQRKMERRMPEECWKGMEKENRRSTSSEFLRAAAVNPVVLGLGDR